MKRFLIIGSSRSGTTAIQSVLRYHKDVAMPPRETSIKPFFSLSQEMALVDDPSLEIGKRIYAELFDYLSEHHLAEGKAFSGLKFADTNPKHARIVVDAMRQFAPSISVIHIVRKDGLARFVSNEVAELRKQWHSFGSSTPGRKTSKKIVVNKALLQHSIAVNFAFNAALSELEQIAPYLRIYYEDFLENPERVIQAICTFLSLDEPVDLAPTAKKLLPPPQEVICNYKQASRWAEEMLEHCGKQTPTFSDLSMKWLSVNRFFTTFVNTLLS